MRPASTRPGWTSPTSGSTPSCSGHPPPRTSPRVADQLGLGGRRWVAFLGTIEPRKNVPALVQRVGAGVAGRLDPPALVLAGGRGWDDAVDGAVAAVPGRPDLLRPGYLPIELTRRAARRGAVVVAYPSLGEGFGLPVLEAMACGAAVLTTRPSRAARGGRGRRGLLGRRRTVDRARARLPCSTTKTGGSSWAARLRPGCRLRLGRGPPRSTSGRSRRQQDAGPWWRRWRVVTGPLRVVAVTYSPGESLVGFLDSLRQPRLGPVDVVLADNGSTDGAPETAARGRERRPVAAHRRQRRLRAGGRTPGWPTSAPGWALVANPDVVFDPAAVDELLAVAARWPRAATVGPAIRTPEGELYPSARDLPSLATGAGHAAVRVGLAGQPVDGALPPRAGSAPGAAGRLAVGVVLPRRPGGLPRRRRVRPRVLHVLRGRRPRRATGPGRLPARLRAVGGRGARGRARHPPVSRTACSGCTTPAPCATCPGSTPGAGTPRCGWPCAGASAPGCCVSYVSSRVDAGARPQQTVDRHPLTRGQAP